MAGSLNQKKPIRYRIISNDFLQEKAAAVIVAVAALIHHPILI